MRSTPLQPMNTGEDIDSLLALLNKAKSEERKDQHLAFSVRLAALSIHAQQKELSSNEMLELLRNESTRFEYSAQEIIL